eukprot:3610919-Alexandrium_andersonii.AAC.1
MAPLQPLPWPAAPVHPTKRRQEVAPADQAAEMAADVSAEVRDEIRDLETLLAVLRDRSRINRIDANSDASWGE